MSTTTPASTGGSWLPDHQLHVAFTLAHVDHLIQAAADLHFDYLEGEPLHLESVIEGALAHVKVAGVAALPEAVTRFTADALTQMRAALEHTLFAQVEFELGRSLTPDEGRLIEMPAFNDPRHWEDWLSNRKRAALAPLARGSVLAGKIRDLQPFQRKNPEEHPLRILAELTNLAKHRMPTVAATRLGLVNPDAYHPDLHFPEGDRALRPGDVLATAPAHVVVGLSIWPKVSIQLPHTGTWHVLLKQLGALEEWVRTVAIPVVILGKHDVPAIPPAIDITKGFPEPRDAFKSAGKVPAAQRARTRITAKGLRADLLETLALHPDGDAEVIAPWVATLDDEAVIAAVERLGGHSRRGDLASLGAEVAKYLSEANAAKVESGN